jgi:lipid-A-disaccharide synthase
VNLLTAERICSWWPRAYNPDAPGAERVLFPEYVTFRDKSEQLARHLIEWLTDAAAYRRRVAQLVALRDRVAHGGASQRAADYILQALAAHGPHGLPAAHIDAVRAARLPTRVPGVEA